MAGQATLSITINGEIDDSNYGGNSFLVTNVGDKRITKVEIDVTDALFPDTVFDPFGEAGDTISKPLRINTAGSTGVVAPDAATYIGAGGISGFEKIQILFDPSSSGGFQPGETLGFSIDMDPNSIAGADKFPLDSGSSPRWDVGGVSGAELIGSTFTVTFEDGTTATGQLQGVLDTASSNSQGGAQALATENPSAGSVTLSVDGLDAGGVGSYGAGGPQVLVSGPAGETALVVLAKGFIQPVNNPFDEPYASQLDAQLAELAGTPFPANNAVEMQVREVLLTGSVQDITSEFDFSGVPINGVADADQLPLAFVAGLVDPANGHLPIGPVSTPIYLTAGSGGLSAVDDTVQSDGAAVEIDVLANDSDDDGGTLGLVSFTQGSQGSVVRNNNGTPGDISDDTLVYTPGGGGGFTGDSFTYQVEDGQGNFETATVTVVSTASGVPAITVNAGLDVSEGASAAIGRGLLATTDDDTQAANLIYTVTALPANGTLTLNGAALGVGDSFTQANVDANALGYTHNGSETAADSFGFEVTDSTTTIEGQSFAIDVAPVNDAPVGASDSYSANAGIPLSVSAATGVLDNDSDAENDVLNVAAVNGSITDIGNAITLPSGATLTLNADGSFQYAPAAGFSGPDSFTYAPGDGTTIGDPVTVSLDVAGGTPAGGFSLNINAGGGAYTAVDGTEFIADAFFSGGIVKTYSSSIAGTQDDTLYRSERTDWGFDYAIPVANGTYAVALDFAENFVGSAGRRVFDVEIEDGLVIDDLDIFAESGGKNIAYSSGVFTVEVTDGVLDVEFLKEVQKPTISAIRISALEIVGQAPVAVDDSYATDEDTPLTVAAAGVLANDDDANGDPLAAVVTSGPSNGVLSLNPNGSFVYTPNANFAGTDSFTYAVSDGNGNSDEATATIAVAAVNDAPDGAADAYATLTGTALSIGAAEGLLANDTDVEGGTVAVAAVEGSAAGVGSEVTLELGRDSHRQCRRLVRLHAGDRLLRRRQLHLCAGRRRGGRRSRHRHDRGLGRGCTGGHHQSRAHPRRGNDDRYRRRAACHHRHEHARRGPRLHADLGPGERHALARRHGSRRGRQLHPSRRRFRPPRLRP